MRDRKEKIVKTEALPSVKVTPEFNAVFTTACLRMNIGKGPLIRLLVEGWVEGRIVVEIKGKE